MIVALAGHVDHGKTSLVRALTGVDTDRLAEEKRRSLTIDLGFAYADIGGRRVGFVDVPGHHRFIQNMVAGIAGRQHALLVVAADDGVMPQSREHLQILRLLGVGAGVVAVNKTDRTTAERVAEVVQEVRALAAGTFLQDAPVVPLSCRTGAGLDALRVHLSAAGEAPGAKMPSAFRLAIDRAFALRGSGLVATGTVVGGSVATDDRLVLGRSGKPVRVRGLRVQGAPAAEAAEGDRAAVNLGGASPADTGRGDWLLDPEMLLPVRQFALRLAVLADFPRPIRHAAPVHVYHATSHSQGRLLLQGGAPVAPGDSALLDLACERPLLVKVGDRLVLRDQDLARTLGGGRVVDVAPWRRRRQPQRLASLEAVKPGDAAATLAALGRLRPVPAAAFRQHWNLPREALADLAEGRGLRLHGGCLLDAALADETAAALRAALAAHHREHPEDAGLAAADLAGAAANGDAVPPMLAALVDGGELRLENGRYALPDHRAAVPPDVLRTFEAVRERLDSTQPPSLGDIAKRLGRPYDGLERAMRALPAFGLAVRVSANRYYLPRRLDELADAAARLDAAGPFTVRQFRDSTGVGRNVVIEVLEHFDAAGFTRRQGDSRTVVGSWAESGSQRVDVRFG